MRVAGWIVSAAVAYIAVLIAQGAFFIAPLVMPVVSIAAAGIAMRPRFRTRAACSAICVLATMAFAYFMRALMYGHLRWWPVDAMGMESFLWGSVLVFALAAELLTPTRLAAYARPASAVTAAAFLVLPSMGTDVIGPYHDVPPLLTVIVVLLAGTAIAARKQLRALRIVEPFLIVCAGWLSAYGTGGWVEGDLRWLLPLIALPASCVAAGSVLLRWKTTSRPSSSDS
jgi:hypothetical protein